MLKIVTFFSSVCVWIYTFIYSKEEKKTQNQKKKKSKNTSLQ